MEISINQSVYYSNRHHLPVEDVAESLLALKGLIENIPDVLEKTIPGLCIRSTNIYINEITAGSLWEDFVVKFIWGTQESLDEDIASLRKSLKIDKLVEDKKLLSCILVSLILAGGISLLNKCNGSDDKKKTLEKNQEEVIRAGAEILNITPDEFKKVITNIADKNVKLQKNAAYAVKPAKNDNEASLTFGKELNIKIENSSVKAMPLPNIDEEDEEIIEDRKAVEILIRATDLDSTKKGWAGVIEKISPRRTKIQLDPHIKPEDLLGKKSIHADITVIYKYNNKGVLYPALYFVREIAANPSINRDG